MLTLNDVHALCLCGGKGFIEHHPGGSKSSCPNYHLHAVLWGWNDTKTKRDTLLVESLATALDDIRRVANREYLGLHDPLTFAVTTLNEIRDRTNKHDTTLSLGILRSNVITDAAAHLHYDYSEGTCVCGERWESEERGCAEKRRLLTYAENLAK